MRITEGPAAVQINKTLMGDAEAGKQATAEGVSSQNQHDSWENSE